MKMKKVLEITPMFSFAAGFIGNRFKYMTNNGFEMHLACTFDPDASSFAEKQGIKYHPVQLNRIPTPWADIKALVKIVRYVHENNIDLIVGHADKGTILAGIAGFLTHRKVITFIHGTNYEVCHGIKRIVYIFVDWLQTRFSTINICVSQFLVDLRTELKIAPRSKQVVPHNGSCCGIDCNHKFNLDLISNTDKQQLKESLGISKNDFVIGFCGRLTKDKGIEELVLSFKSVQLEIGMNTKLLLVGDNDIRDAIPEYISREISTNKSIICTGKIYNRIELYYSIMDLFVLPTHRDGFGMCLIEAAAMGVPVLSSPYTGSRNAMSAGFNGDYINIDPADIKNKIIELYSKKDRLSYYSKNGIDWVRNNFSNKVVWDSIIEIYKEVLEF